MSKKIIYTIKLEGIQGGAATPGPPIGARLGSKGLKAMDFCKQFNERTQNKKGQLLPVVISVYGDKTFDFIIKSPPAATLIRQAAKINKGAAEPNRNKVGSISQAQLKEIATIKQQDTNAFDTQATMRIIAGTARSMGVLITA